MKTVEALRHCAKHGPATNEECWICLDEGSRLPATPPVTIIFEPCSTWAGDFVGAIRRHYTKSRGAPPGKKLAWRILEKRVEGQEPFLVGWIGLGEPSFKLAPRRRLGLQDARPLDFTVCCFIFRLESKDRLTPASSILRAWHPIAAQAWAQRYGWEPLHWETMVGQGAEGNPGACFKRAGYRSLGLTTGRSARRVEGSMKSTGSHGSSWWVNTGKRAWHNAAPKLVLYRGPLARK